MQRFDHSARSQSRDRLAVKGLTYWHRRAYDLTPIRIASMDIGMI